jgi:broad specificity phosphatase PhoE
MDKFDAGLVNQAFFAGIPAATRFFIIRHGQSEANAIRVVQGLKDFPLDATGRLQAAELGDWLGDKSIDCILASPLRRASETASIITRRLGLPCFESLPDLREIDTGSFSGLSLEDSRERFPKDYAAFERLSWEGVSDAERESEVYARALRVWTVLRDRAFSGSRNIACVTHGGFIQWLVRVTFGTRTWMPLLPTGNCGVFELLVKPVPGGAQLYWERLNFQAPGSAVPTPPAF